MFIRIVIYLALCLVCSDQLTYPSFRLLLYEILKRDSLNLILALLALVLALPRPQLYYLATFFYDK